MFPTFQNTRSESTPPGRRKKHSLAKSIQDRSDDDGKNGNKTPPKKKKEERPSSLVELILGCKPENISSGVEGDITHLRKKLRKAKNWGASKADLIFISDKVRQISDIYFSTVIGLIDTQATEEVYALSAKALLEVKPLRLALEKKAEETRFTWAGGNVGPETKEIEAEKKREKGKAMQERYEARENRKSVETEDGSERYPSPEYRSQDQGRMSRGYSERDSRYTFEEPYQPAYADEYRPFDGYSVENRDRSEYANGTPAEERRQVADNYSEHDGRYREDFLYDIPEYPDEKQSETWDRQRSSFDIVGGRYLDRESRYDDSIQRPPENVPQDHERPPSRKQPPTDSRYTNSTYGRASEYQNERATGAPKLPTVREKGYSEASTSSQYKSRDYILNHGNSQSPDIPREEGTWNKARASRNTENFLSELEGEFRREGLNQGTPHMPSYLPYRKPSPEDSLYDASSVGTHMKTGARERKLESSVPRQSDLESRAGSATRTSNNPEDRSYPKRRYPESGFR
ncbi:hypothetical protein TWF694_011247 [Orbilia ellipsospora]|uniref:Uncharacterized protein n=1 Tax=Orbilia ellipsospora TaxID=2528407 RepID=A0AAV9X8H8_9PEZI